MSLLGAAAFTDAIADTVDMFTATDKWVVGTNVRYAPPVEFGTYKMAAQPHVRPGIDATEAQMARLAAGADDIDEFLRLTAFQLEREIKARTPVLTGNLRASYRAQKL
jgi:hypothetical protein